MFTGGLIPKGRGKRTAHARRCPGRRRHPRIAKDGVGPLVLSFNVASGGPS